MDQNRLHKTRQHNVALILIVADTLALRGRVGREVREEGREKDSGKEKKCIKTTEKYTE